MVKEFINSRFDESFHPAILLWTVRVGEVVFDTQILTTFMEVEEVFRTVIGLGSDYTKRKVGFELLKKFSGGLRGSRFEDRDITVTAETVNGAEKMESLTEDVEVFGINLNQRTGILVFKLSGRLDPSDRLPPAGIDSPNVLRVGKFRVTVDDLLNG